MSETGDTGTDDAVEPVAADTDAAEVPVKKKAAKKASSKYVNSSTGNIFTAQGKIRPGQECTLTKAEVEALGNRVTKA